jgi:hypothetical protein
MNHVPPFAVINGTKVYSEEQLSEYLEANYRMITVPRMLLGLLV